MRPRLRILAIISFAFCFYSTKQVMAAGLVWFEASPISTNASVTQNGAPGAALDLACDLNQGLSCAWNVVALYQILDGGAFSWAVELGTTDPLDDGKFVAGSIEVSVSALSQHIQPTISNQGGGLLVSAAASTLSTPSPPPGLYTLFHFILAKQKAAVDHQVSNIYAAVGPLEFGGNDPGGFDFYEVIQFGPNAPIAGYNSGPWPYGALPLPVITVTNIPEPASFVCLIAGCLLLTRTRNRASAAESHSVILRPLLPRVRELLIGT
ncbi:hypothetical protein B7486_02600 [cyanobacterium TDX16]|nr:hypothetical protein B7486_02600 [cyanobacterium TDX16]